MKVGKTISLLILVSFMFFVSACTTTSQYVTDNKITTGEADELMKELAELPRDWKVIMEKSSLEGSRIVVGLLPEDHGKLKNGLYNSIVEQLDPIVKAHILEQREGITKNDLVWNIKNPENPLYLDPIYSFIVQTQTPIICVEDWALIAKNYKLKEKLDSLEKKEDPLTLEAYLLLTKNVDERTIKSLRNLEKSKIWKKSKKNKEVCFFLFHYGYEHMEDMREELIRRGYSVIYFHSDSLLADVIGLRARLMEKYAGYKIPSLTSTKR